MTAMKKRGIPFDRFDERNMSFQLGEPTSHPLNGYGVVFERCIAQSRALVVTEILNMWGIPTVNSFEVIKRCGDKLSTTLALATAGVAVPDTRIAVDPEQALAVIEDMGYPVVLKPVVGSWGRLLARVNDRSAAEALLEHKSFLGSPVHSIFYMQAYVHKPGRDIRVSVVGDEVISAIYRYSDHWVTNTARGGRAEFCPISDAIEEICLKTSQVVGGGILAIDLLESPEGLLVNEVNPTMEFRSSIEPTGVDVPGKMVEYVMQQAERRGSF